MPKRSKYDGLPENWVNTIGNPGAAQKAETLKMMCDWVIKACQNKEEVNKEIAQAGGKADADQIKRLKKCDEIIDNNLRAFLCQYDDKRFRRQCDAAIKAIKVAAVRKMFEDTISNYAVEEHKRSHTNG